MTDESPPGQARIRDAFPVETAVIVPSVITLAVLAVTSTRHGKRVSS